MKKYAKQFLTLCLTGAMLTGLLCPAMASGTYHATQPVSDLVVKNNQDYDGRQITYRDIYSGQQSGRPRLSSGNVNQLYMDAVTNRNNFLEWVNLAYNIHATVDGSYNDDEDRGWSGYSSKDSGYKVDYINAMMTPYSHDGSEYDVKSTGLSYANSLREVQTRAADSIASLLDRKMTGGDILGQHEDLYEMLTEDKQTVIYSTVTSLDRYGSVGRFSYNAFSIAFYNFEITPVDDGSALNTVTTNVSDKNLATVEIEGFDYSKETTETNALFKNNSLDEATVTLTTGESSSSSIQSSLTESSTITNGVSVGAGAALNIKIPALGALNFNLSGQYTYNQALGYAMSNQTGSTTSNSNTIQVTMKSPAHTVITGSQSTVTSEMTTTYDCPVAVTYNVAIFSMNGNMYDDDMLIQSFDGYTQRSFLTNFGDNPNGVGDDAAEDIYWLATKNGSNTSYNQSYGYTLCTDDNGKVLADHLNWTNILAQGVPSTSYSTGQLSCGTEMIYDLDDDYPMSVTGGTMAFQEAVIVAEVADEEAAQAVPLYPIGSVYVKWQLDKAIELEVGETHALNSYRVHAMDTAGAPYHGFLYGNGTWKIVDANGKECTSDVAEMVYDSVTGEQLLVTKAPGVTHVKYFINEKDSAGNHTYVTYDGTPSLNANIKSAAYKVVVAEPPADPQPFTGAVELTGEDVQLVVGEIDNLNALEGVTVAAYEKDGTEASPDISWEAQEETGITVASDGTIKVTQAGVYHVRAYCDNSGFYDGDAAFNVYSDWIEVTATEPVRLIQYVCYHPFTDVAHGAWYEPAVEFVYQDDMMNGVKATVFQPNGQVTRAMVAQTLYNLEGSSAVTGENPFADVADDTWYAKAVAWAAANGLTTGVKADVFAPNDPVTREQLVTFLCRYVDWKGLELPEGDADLSRFQDAGQVSPWAKDFIVRSLEAGVIQGKSDAELAPRRTAARAELAQVLMNLLAE